MIESDVADGEAVAAMGAEGAGVTGGLEVAGVAVPAGAVVAHPAARIARTQARKRTGTRGFIRRITYRGYIKPAKSKNYF